MCCLNPQCTYSSYCEFAKITNLTCLVQISRFDEQLASNNGQKKEKTSHERIWQVQLMLCWQGPSNTASDILVAQAADKTAMRTVQMQEPCTPDLLVCHPGPQDARAMHTVKMQEPCALCRCRSCVQLTCLFASTWPAALLPNISSMTLNFSTSCFILGSWIRVGSGVCPFIWFWFIAFTVADSKGWKSSCMHTSTR